MGISDTISIVMAVGILAGWIPNFDFYWVLVIGCLLWAWTDKA